MDGLRDFMGLKSPAEKMMESRLQLKMSAKNMQRMENRAKKNGAAQRKKLEKAIADGNVEESRIYAQNCVRETNNARKYLRFRSRIEATHDRVANGEALMSVAKEMVGVTRAMEASMASMNLEKTQQMMDRFEASFDRLDVQSAVMDGAMSDSVATSTPENEVNALMRQVADEKGLEIQMELPEVGVGNPTSQTLKTVQIERELASIRRREFD